METIGGDGLEEVAVVGNGFSADGLLGVVVAVVVRRISRKQFHACRGSATVAESEGDDALELGPEGLGQGLVGEESTLHLAGPLGINIAYSGQ